jgi:3-hydroxybutyryl-CoA dehydrogenase
MPLDASRPDLTLAVVGTGVMGRGIAQIAAQAGLRVVLYDTRAEAASAAREYVAKMLTRLAEKGRLAPEAAQAAVARIDVAQVLGHLDKCDVVVEAILEELAAKRELFHQLESIVSPECILATNTSSLQVTTIAASCKHPERVAGFHFFNPVPLMKVVEVIDGVMTAPWVGAALTALAGRMGHTPVRAQDTPGFIVNHAGRGYGTEAFQILREGIAEFHQIDRVLREAAGFRMGPFELVDLTGLDVSHAVMESIYHQYYQEPRYRPSPIAAQRVGAGLFGRKSDGRGFYRYNSEGNPDPIADAPTPRSADVPVWVSRAGLGADLSELVARLGARAASGARPDDRALCLVAPLGKDATTAALDEGLDATRTVAVDCLPGPARRRTIMTTPLTSPAMRDAAHALLAGDGVPVTVIHDSPGFIAQRVIAQIINIGADIAQQRIATPQDIDRAVTLGLGYPTGPLAWGDAIGPARVLAILGELFDFYQDPRYRASPWLKRRARLGVSLLTPET